MTRTASHFLPIALCLTACQSGAGPGDAASGLRSCSSQLTGEVARYDFEDLASGQAQDAAGAHPGAIVGVVESVMGPQGCGRAARFTTGQSAFIRIADSPAWQLEAGSVDFWFRPAVCGAAEQGVITRDAQWSDRGGHFRVFLRPDCHLSVRSQALGDQGVIIDNSTEVISAVALPVNAWSHVAVNFGAPSLELILDGVPAGTAAITHGIEGNQNPWAIGMSNDDAPEGAGLPLSKPLEDAAIDRIRISSLRHDFSK